LHIGSWTVFIHCTLVLPAIEVAVKDSQAGLTADWLVLLGGQAPDTLDWC
jgi:hypothetical protein